MVAISDGGGVVRAALRPVLGAAKVGRFFHGLLSRRMDEVRDMRVEPVLVEGGAAVLVRGRWPDGSRLLSVLTAAVEDGRITGLFLQQNPEKVLLGDLG